VVLQDEISEIYKPKLVRYVRLVPQFATNDRLEILLHELRNAEKQKQVILAYFSRSAINAPITVQQLVEASGATVAVIKALIDKGIFEEYHLQHDRVVFDADQSRESPQLSEAQLVTYHKITHEFGTRPTVLLHGITSSGKTEIYIKVIESFLVKGKQVLYLLPEIALTTQLVSRLVAYFGNQVAVFHSKYNNNERVEVWRNVLSRSEKARVVIGARSALFL